MAQETEIAAEWLYETFVGDATLTGLIASRAYHLQAPQEAVYPLVIFAPMSGNDNNTLGARAAAELVMLIKAIMAGEDTPQAIMDRVDALVSGQQVTKDGHRLLWRRIGTIGFPEIRAGKRYNHLGGLYRCFTRLA